MITFIDEKGTEHSALVAYSVTNAVNGELSVKGTIYTNDKVLHGIGRGWRFRLDDEYFRITYAKPNDTGRHIEVEFDAVHQFFYDMSKSMVYTTLNGSKPFETYLQAIFSGSGYTYNLETTVGSIRKENFGNKSRLSLFNDIIKAAGLEFSVRGHVIRILKRIGTDLSTIVRKDFNMNELKIEKNINSFVTYQRGLGAWKDDEDHSKGRYETSYESPLSAIYGRIEADPIVDERYKDTGKLLERLKENVDKSYKVSVEIDMEDLSQAGYRISRPNPGDYIMAINETLGFRQKVRIVSFTSEYDVGGNLISRKVVCNDIGTVQRVTSEISHLSRTLTDSIEGSERALKTATKALVSADGKNTNYFGDVKPLDVPKGTLRKGDRLFLTVGDKKQLYFWNGAEWELEPTEFDHEKFDMEFNRNSQEIKKTIQENRQKAEEALRNAGASNLLAQEAKRIGLDSIARLEAFKSQAMGAQTALSGDLDALKRTIANDIRPKQEQVTAEIVKQVEALNRTKNELAGVKSAQSTYEETTTRRLAELTSLADGKASKSELVQTAEELASKIASVQASGRNLFLNSLFKKDISKTGIWTTSTYEATIDSTDKYLGHNALKIVGQNPSGRDNGNPKITYPAFGQFGKVISGSTTNQDVTISFYAKASKNGILLRSRLGNINYKTGNVILSTEIKRYVVHIPKGWTNESKFSTNEWLFNFNQEGTVWIWMPKFEISDVDTSYSEAPEDIEGQISAVESNFKQRADALDAGVIRLTEGIRTKADISSLNVTAENIRQSVKSLETSTQNKLDQKLSMTEFEVRAGSIHQEILNATKDKADKTLVVAEAGKLREEFSNLRVGGTNLLKGSKGPFLPDRKPANFDNAILYVGQTSIYMEQGQEYIISAKTDGTFTAHHDGNKESDNVVLWIMDKDVRNYQIVSDLKTGTTGTKIIWNKPTGIYHLRVNTYHKEATKSVWDVKIEKGNVATDWSPAPEDTDGLITEAKAIFERTAQGLRTDLSAIQEYVNKDGQRQDALQRYAREESAKQATAVRELVARDYVGKSTYQEDVRGLERRFEAITNPQNGSIATQIANYKTAVDGRFSDITSLIAGKANQTDFQRVKETSQLYERILGNSENGIADKIARMAMTNQLFQVEVSKVFENHRNLFLSSTATKGFLGNAGVINVANSTQKEITSDFISVEPNEKIIFQHWVTLPENGMAWTAWQFFDKNKNSIDVRRTGLNAYKTTTGKQHNINQIIVPANAYFIRVSARMYNDGLIKIERGSAPSNYSATPEDTDEAIRTVQSQLAGSWGVHNKNSVNEIIAGFNLAGRNAGIKAETIRLEGNTLADKLTAIDGYFKRLFVGEGTFATLNADVIRSNSITADKLVMDMAMARRFVSSDLFTDTLAAKEAFINKLRSVVVTATFLEGFQGKIGGFRFGQYTNRNGYFITGINSVSVGMGNGTNAGANRNAFWANWGESLDTPGPKSWYVNTDGTMYCRNEVSFYSTVDFASTSKVNFYSRVNAEKGLWLASDDVFGEGENPVGGYNRVVWWSQIVTGKFRQHAGITTGSDRRLKENIEPTPVKALDKINALNLVAFDYIKDKTHEEIGLIAQEVLNIIPGSVEKYEGEDNHLTINYSKFVPYLIKAIQELNEKIEEMEKTVA
ncbi:phage tail protein [Streptococcus infantis]|uniref:phage tail protein n=2 Tax=Bacilli TaxID=91061 RepID=UPI0039C4882C